MDVSIILVNYNTRDLLQAAITSVFRHTSNLSYEIIVVDNASVDDSVSMVQEWFPQIELIESRENLGFGRANNLGAEIAKGEFLFFLNSDTLLTDNSIRKMYEFLKSRMDVACVGGILVNSEGEEIHSYGNFPTLKGHLMLALSRLKKYFLSPKRKIFGIQERRSENPFEVPYITGADLMIRKSVWDKTGGFDPAIFMYCEESELQYRISLRGYKRVILPNVHIVHLVGKSCMIKNRTRVMHMRSTLYYLKKYSSGRFSYRLFLFAFYLLSFFDFDRSYTAKERREYLSLLNPFKK